MKTVKKWLFPPLWVVILLCLLSGGGLLFVFGKGYSEHPLGYGVYALSAYAMTVLCVKLGKTLPNAYRRGKEKVYSLSLGERYFTDREFKGQVSLLSSLAVNLVYVGINGISLWRYKSWWFGIFAVYYGWMALMRLMLVKVEKDEESQRKRCGVCGGLLLTVNLLLSGMVMMMVSFGKGFEYRGVLIYVQALYTFCVTGFAIRDLVRERKNVSPVLTASKAIKLTAALFSMLFLETGMFAQFGGEMSQRDQRIFLAATGAGICLVVTLIGIFLIRTGKKKGKTLEESKSSNL